MLTRKLAPAALLPLSLVEAQRHCKVEPGDEDDYVEGLIRAAAGAFERESKLPLMLAPYVTVLDRWTTVTFLAGTIGSISKVEYVNPEGLATELPADRYSIGVISPDSLVLSGLGPAHSRVAEPIRVYYTAGYTTPDEVPAEIKQWLLLLIGHWYENRTPLLVAVNAQEVPLTNKYLMSLLREPTI